jgi:hypothetical protein
LICAAVCEFVNLRIFLDVDILERKARKVNPKANLTSLEIFVIGAISKTISTVVTYPYILAKVRLQWKSYEKKEELQYRGTVDVLAKVIKAEGVQGIFKVSFFPAFLSCTPTD